jgi:hypothetical protein
MVDPKTSESAIKPAISPVIVRKLLGEHFHWPIHGLKRLESGEVAQTFSFTVEPANEPTPREYMVFSTAAA